MTAHLQLTRQQTTVPASGDLLGFYLDTIRRVPKLDADESLALALAYADGDRHAGQRLVMGHLHLVVKLARQHREVGGDLLDLVQEGNEGLTIALDRYDPTVGVPFASYARYWIRARMLRYLSANHRVMNLGSTRHGRKLFFQLRKEIDRLRKAGVAPSPAAIAQALDVPESEVHAVSRALLAPAASLDERGERGQSLLERIPNSRSVDPEATAARRELGSRLQEALQAFADELEDEREARLWHARLLSTDPLSFSQLAAEFGVSKQRVHQWEARLKKRLKAFLSAELGDHIDIE